MRLAFGKLSLGLTMAMVMAAGLLVVGAAPAHAYTCGYNDLNVYLSFKEVKVTFKFEEECTDGNARIKGTVYDVLCDGRQAHAGFRLVDTTPNPDKEMWARKAIAGGGCGSSSSFTFSGASAGQFGWQLNVTPWACSWVISCATHYRSYYG